MFKRSIFAVLALAASVGTASALRLAPQIAANVAIDTAQALTASPYTVGVGVALGQSARISVGHVLMASPYTVGIGVALGRA
jgi:hypothetical protein